MHCLSNIERISYPSDLVMDLTKLYRFKGKDFYYEDVLKPELKSIIKSTIERDAFYASKILNLNITESRIRLILKKDSIPKTKDENILANLKEIFTLIQEKPTQIELTTNEFLQLAKKAFNNVKNINYQTKIKKVKISLLTDSKKVSKRESFQELLDLYKKLNDKEAVESTQLITNFYVDLIHMNIFTEENELISILILYCLIFRERFYVLKYYSFFEIYYERLEEFKKAVAASSFNWDEGFSQTSMLNRLLISVMLDGYDIIEKKLSNNNFDKNLKKIDNVETTILKLGEIFTKDQIKAKHPTLSDSTINRALKILKDENKIRPNGTGRSATWVRLANEDDFQAKLKQMSLFDILMEDEKDK